jgi:PAS domain S-box-containing protein
MVSSSAEQLPTRWRQHAFGFLTVGALTGTFVLDLLTPLGVAAWALYPIAILAAWMWRGRWAIGVVTMLAIVFTLLGTWLSPSGHELTDLINRVLAVGMISVVGIICVRIDRHEAARRRAEETRLESESRLDSVMQSAADAIILADRYGNIVSWNKAAAAIFGYGEREALGKPLTLLIPERYREAHRKGLERVRSTGEARLIGKSVELQGLRKDGSEFPLELSLAMCKAREETLFTGIIRDISDRKRAEALLKESVERFDLAVKGSREGLWDAWAVSDDPFNPRNSCYFSPRFKELLEYGEQEFEPVIGSWSSRLHPEDRDRVFDGLRAHLERKVPYDIEYRMYTKYGECRWFAARGQAVWDEAGRPIRMSGSFSDITVRKRAEQRLAKINECLLSFSPDAYENINRLTALCGELMEGTCALYNRLEGGLLCSLGQWRTPPGYNPVDKPDGHICYDVIQGGGDGLLVVRNLPQTSYARTDPNVMPYKLQAYIGKAVKCGGVSIGSLCVVYQKDFVPDETDERLMGIIASAIGVEEERRRGEEEERRLVVQLQDATASLKTLSGLLPICASCKKIRDDRGSWNQIEDYIKERSEALFTHGICPECARKVHPDWDDS